MTFGKINIEKSLVARRDTAESKTDDRGQLMGANNNVNGEESQQQKQHNSTTCALAQHHERRGERIMVIVALGILAVLGTAKPLERFLNSNNLIQQHVRSHNTTSAEERGQLTIDS